jgi:uncharacterized phiE125 gp8 family phage protein
VSIATGRTLVTDPATEPVSTSDLVDHLREGDDVQIPLLLTYIQAAREWVEKRTWRALITQTWDFHWSRFPLGRREIEVPLPPLQSVTSVTYKDSDGATQTLPSDDYEVDASAEPGLVRLKPGKSWPTTGDYTKAVTVRAVAGYGNPNAVPARYRQAIQLIVGHWYAHRESVVVGTITSRVPFAVEALVDQDHMRGTA